MTSKESHSELGATEHVDMDLSIWTASALPSAALLRGAELTPYDPLREQLRQASAAIFWDNDLSFASPSLPSARPAHFTPLRPPVHHESETPLDFAGLSVVGGLDISFREDGTGEEGVAVLAVLSFPGLKVRPFPASPLGASTDLESTAPHESLSRHLPSRHTLRPVLPLLPRSCPSRLPPRRPSRHGISCPSSPLRRRQRSLSCPAGR